MDQLREYDAAYSAPGIGRFRVNVYRQRGSLAIVMRFIPIEIPTVTELGLPIPVCLDLTDKRSGMVLVVGAAGTGKSTSIAAMIEHLNANRAVHVVTVEDPIDFLHRDKVARSVSVRSASTR